MARNTYSPEQIIRKLRETEVYIGKGMTAREAARQIGVTEQTYYRWRKEYGGMRVEQAKCLKILEKENMRLKRLVAQKEDRSITGRLSDELKIFGVFGWVRIRE